MFAERTKVFKAMGSETRQMILKVIDDDVNRPGHIARELGRPRSTVEKHLRVLLGAGIIEKIPELNEQGHLSVRYEIKPVAYRLRDAVKGS